MQRFCGGLASKAHRLLYHSTLGVRVRKQEKKGESPPPKPTPSRACQPFETYPYPPKATGVPRS
jgi:hypothetical protein